MKKLFTLSALMLLALVSFQMNAEMYIIGAISPDGWNPSKGVQMTSTDGTNYTVDIDVTKTGNQYFGFTEKLGSSSSDWDGIKSSRWGGNVQITLDKETTLTKGTDQSPYLNFANPGVYTFNINASTGVCKVSAKSTVELPTFNGTIYISKSSTGNIWAWDNGGNYFSTWPGDAINSLETATVNGVEYYSFTYSHNESSPGLIFNDGTAQTSDIVPEDGKVYTYAGGTTYTVTTPTTGPAPDPTGKVYILGNVNGNEWSAYNGVEMTKTDEGYYAKITTGSNAGYSYFSFSEKLAEPTDTANMGWDAIADYRFGALSLDDFEVTSDMLGNEIGLSDNGLAAAFKIAAGEFEITLDLNARKMFITGDFTQIEIPNELYVLGQVNGNSWAPNVGVKMEAKAENVYEATVTCDGIMEGYNFFSFSHKLADTETDWDAIAAYRFGSSTDEDCEITEDLLGTPFGLGANGSSVAFKIAEGKYTLTVDTNARTLIVAKASEALAGDLNDDGEVNSSDVSALVNIILNGIDDSKADVNGDGAINASDTSSLINIILNK